MYYSTRNRRRLTFETLMAMPSEPESKAFYTYTDGEDRVEVLNDTFTIVLSRDVRRNSRIAAEIAFQIAKERPEDDVLYVNTYAGVALMKESFTKALEKSGMIPGQSRPKPRLSRGQTLETAEEQDVADAAPEKIRMTVREAIDACKARAIDYLIHGSTCEVYGNGVTDEDTAWAASIEIVSQYQDDEDEDEWQDPNDDSDDDQYGQEPSILSNLFIHDVPFGTWDTARLERDIQERGRKKCHTIVVLNSFEFATMSRDGKSRMAKELLELRSKMGLSFVVFSHDLKRDLAAGLPCRGSLGIIAANAGSVQRLIDPFENLVRHRKKEERLENRRKQAENGVVHEAQMRAASVIRRGPYIKIPIFRSELEQDQWFREQKELPDYHADPWLGKTEKLGRELLPLARSRVLQRYFEEHLDHVFTKGQEPTEYELETKTYEAKEVQKKWLM